jgi:hypothetical protein
MCKTLRSGEPPLGREELKEVVEKVIKREAREMVGGNGLLKKN